jgi:hypothetical protein
MKIPTASYADQSRQWPQAGRHILAHFDEDTIVVYQACSPKIGRFAASHGFFGGEFKYSRMSWIKPNFLWMMHRSDWGRSPGQEVVLAVRVRRSFFDSLLKLAVPSTFIAGDFATESEWKRAVERSDVRLQWDPDHLPTGDKCERRAIQLGLRGAALEAYGKHEVVELIDMTEFVAEQRTKAGNWQNGDLLTPEESVYVPADASITAHLGLAQ